jgi:hypothetical protein
VTFDSQMGQRGKMMAVNVTGFGDGIPRAEKPGGQQYNGGYTGYVGW